MLEIISLMEKKIKQIPIVTRYYDVTETKACKCAF